MAKYTVYRGQPQWRALTASNYPSTGLIPVSNLLLISMSVYYFAGINTNSRTSIASINGYYNSNVLTLKMMTSKGELWSEPGLVLLLGK